MVDTSFAIRLCEPADTPRIVPLLQAQVAASGQPAPDPDALAELVHALLISQFSDFLLAFEIVGVLLLAAVIGGVFLAKREPGGPS